jgi:hypothetical protein
MGSFVETVARADAGMPPWSQIGKIQSIATKVIHYDDDFVQVDSTSKDDIGRQHETSPANDRWGRSEGYASLGLTSVSQGNFPMPCS